MTTGKDSSEVCAIACQNCAAYSFFPSDMTSHNKIAHFNWKCRGRFKPCCPPYRLASAITVRRNTGKKTAERKEPADQSNFHGMHKDEFNINLHPSKKTGGQEYVEISERLC